MGVRRKRQHRLIGWTVSIADSSGTVWYTRVVGGLEVAVTTSGGDKASLRVRSPEERAEMYGSNFIADLPVNGNDIAGTLQRINLMLRDGGLAALSELKDAIDTLRTL